MLAYTTGTINQPDAGSVGLEMANQIRDDVVASASWDLVEEFTPASGAVRWYVFKCLATGSGLPADFFVVMGRTLGSGELRFAIGEGYDSTSHTLSKFGQNPAAPTFDANGCTPNTFVLGTTAFNSSSGTPKYFSWTPSGTSTKWWIIVDDDGFTVAFNGAANGFVHVGAYVPLTGAGMPVTMPLMIIGSTDPGGYGAITRNPAVAGATPAGYNNALNILGGVGASLQSSDPILGFQGQYRYNDKLQDNERPVAEIGIGILSGSSDWSQVTGWALGKHKRMRGSIQAMPAGFAFGDAFALGGTLWVPYLPTDGRIWNTGVASS